MRPRAALVAAAATAALAAPAAAPAHPGTDPARSEAAPSHTARSAAAKHRRCVRRSQRRCSTLRTRVSKRRSGAPASFTLLEPLIRGELPVGNLGAPAGPAGAAGAPAGPSGPADPGGPPPPPPPPSSDPRRLQVRSTEFRLTLSRSAVLAGSVQVELNNSGAEDPHDLVVIREDGTGDPDRFGEVPAGGIETRTLALQTGAYTLFCSILDHAELGMSARLVVDSG